MNELKDRLIRLRGDASRDDFAKIVNVKPTTWRNYELGSTLPNADVLLTICKKLNIAPLWLLAGEGPMRPEEPAQPAANAPEPPANTAETAGQCPRCAKMEAELEKERDERRELAQDNRQLLRENGDLKAKCAVLEERQKHCCPEPQVFEKLPNIPPSKTDLRT